MTPDQVLSEVLKSDSLPTLPAVAARLLAIASQEETTMADIADLVAMDVALSSKVLRVVNSAFYSFPQPIGSIQKAVSVLGTNAVRSLVLSFSLLNIRAQCKDDRFDYQQFWNRSVTAGVAAKLIMAQIRKTDPEEIFIAGMLQNIGEMILARTFAEDYRLICQQSGDDDDRLLALEQERFGVDHAWVGARVLEHWGLPPTLVSPVSCHHDPVGCAGADRNLVVTSQVVYLSALLSRMFYSERPDLLRKTFRSQALRLLRLSDRTLDLIEAQIQSEVNETAKFFDINLVLSQTVEELLQEANQKLAQLNMSYEQMNRELLQTKMELFRLNKELQEKNAKLENLVNIDPLTEVYNHRYFQSFLQQELRRAQRNERPLSLILIDVDNFKKFNDQHGHLVGDFILKEACRIATATLRKDDLFARYGGEEFICVLPETGAEEAAATAEMLRAAIADCAFEQGPERYGVTVSLGVATLTEFENDSDNDSLIGMADQALLIAKKNGKNRAEIYSPKAKWFTFKS